MNEFIQILLGGQSAIHFLALLFFSLFAASLSLLLHTTARDVFSTNTPKPFNWMFFLSDNWKRILTGLMLIYIALRFAPQLFGVEIDEFWALVIGFGNDKIAQFLKDKTNMLGQKKEGYEKG